MFPEIREKLRCLYLEDPRPWLVGFSGGKDSTMVASLVFEAVASIPPEERTKPIALLCTDTRVEIPAVVERIEGTLARMRRCSERDGLGIPLVSKEELFEIQKFWKSARGPDDGHDVARIIQQQHGSPMNLPTNPTRCARSKKASPAKRRSPSRRSAAWWRRWKSIANTSAPAGCTKTW